MIKRRFYQFELGTYEEQHRVELQHLAECIREWLPEAEVYAGSVKSDLSILTVEFEEATD